MVAPFPHSCLLWFTVPEDCASRDEPLDTCFGYGARRVSQREGRKRPEEPQTGGYHYETTAWVDLLLLTRFCEV